MEIYSNTWQAWLLSSSYHSLIAGRPPHLQFCRLMGIKEIGIAGSTKLLIHEFEDVCDSTTGHALTGSWVWKSAFILSHWISTQKNYDFTNKTVLELGAGTGLPGLTTARLGAARVILTDIEPLIPVLEKNVEANGLGEKVEVCELVWGSDELPSGIGELGRVDLVLLSDVFYDSADMAALAKTLKKVCEKATTVWAATEIRSSTCECLSELVNEGFGIVELSNQRGGEGGGGISEEELISGGGGEDFVVFQLVPPNLEVDNIEATTRATTFFD